MKFTLQRDLSATETEVTIRYADMNSRLQKITEELQQYGFALTGYQQSREYQVPLDTIYFIDSTDGKIFIYQIKEVYECKETLSSLINKLPKTAFVRISKNCITESVLLYTVSLTIALLFDWIHLNIDSFISFTLIFIIVDAFIFWYFRHRQKMLAEEINSML